MNKKKSKYRNKKVEWNGLKFDSEKEWKRYIWLSELEKNGYIRELDRQTSFELIPKQQGERSVNYIADFTYYDGGGNFVAEDVKSVFTKTLPEYVIKRKLLLYIYGIKIKEV